MVATLTWLLAPVPGHSAAPYAAPGTYPYTTKSLIQFRGPYYMSIDPKKIFITPLLYIVTYLWAHVWTSPVL